MEKKKIDGLFGSFVFIGTPTYNEEKYYKNEVSASGYKYSKLQFGVKVSDINTPYVDLMGGFSTTKENIIYALDKDKNKLEIAFKDRNDANIINNVMDFKKLKVNFTSSDEKESKVFIAEYDFVEAIKAGLTKDMRVVVIGDFSIERYVDKDGKKVVNQKYIPKKIRLAREDETNKAELTLGFVFDKDALDKSRLESEGKIDVSAYMTVYDKVLKQNVFVPQTFVIDFNYLSSIALKPLDDKGKAFVQQLFEKYFTAEGSDIMETQWKAEVFRGAVKEEITEDDLSEDEKLQIEYGLASFEQIKRQRGFKYGDRINEIRLTRPTNKFELEDGTKLVNKKTEYTEDDFIIPEVGTESKDAVFNGEVPVKTDEDTAKLNALFG